MKRKAATAKARKVDAWERIWQNDRESEVRVRGTKDVHADTTVACPFCGETGEVVVDEIGATHETFIEDCEVCCHPREVHVERDETGGMKIWCERS